MKPTLPTAILLLASCAAPLPAEGSPKPIDDRQIRSSFEQQLGKLRDENKAPDPNTLQKQLRERQQCKIDLPDPEAAGTLSTAQVYEGRKDGVLCFGNIYKCKNCDDWHGNIAGGFVITEDGVAVTNYHVMENAEAGAFGAMTSDGEIHVVEEVLAASKPDDLAIVRLRGSGFKPLPLASGEKVGAKVVAISHPEGRFYTVSEGIISRYYRQRGKSAGAERVSITADFAKGSSGCPVFSSTGAVVAVIASTNSIYYNRDKDGARTNLQMVIKSCVPTSSIIKLIDAAN